MIPLVINFGAKFKSEIFGKVEMISSLFGLLALGAAGQPLHQDGDGDFEAGFDFDSPSPTQAGAPAAISDGRWRGQDSEWVVVEQPSGAANRALKSQGQIQVEDRGQGQVKVVSEGQVEVVPEGRPPLGGAKSGIGGGGGRLAECKFDGSGTGRVKGTVTLCERDGELHISGGLVLGGGGKVGGPHGFHVHQQGSLGNGCKDAKGHYNPLGKNHGAPTDSDRHVGDLGNVRSDSDGDIAVDIKDRIAKLSGQHSILGRSLVLHAKGDDLGRGGNQESKKTGNAGKRLACCVIKSAVDDQFCCQ